MDPTEEDCTIFIEELKSDDPNLKINAVTKIGAIAKILGPSRTCQELIPYLIDIIEEQDNEDEFLIKLAQELIHLKGLVGGNTKVQLLIAPLEILSSMEEPLVREKAVEALIYLSEGMNEQFFENHFFPIIQQLGQWDNYPSRISAASLLPLAYPHVSDEKKQLLWSLFKQLCEDDTPMVRRVCGGVLSQLAQLNCLQDGEHKTMLLMLWQKLLRDQIDSVKIKAIEGSQYMLKLIDDSQDLQRQVEGYFQLADQKEKSWRVRYTVPEHLESIIDIISRINKDKSILKTQAVPIFQQLLNDTEPEVRSVTLHSLYFLLKELPNTQKEQFLQPLSLLVEDKSPHVRLSLAEQICKISKQFQLNTVITSLIPIVSKLIKDEVIEIKIKLAHNLDQLSQGIGPEHSKKHLVPLISTFVTEKQWRYRLEMMSIIPKLLKVAGYDCFLELQEVYLEKGVLNHYQAIRDQAIENFSSFKETFGYDQIKEFLKKCLSALFQQTNYIYRVTAMHSVSMLREVLSKEDLVYFFKEFSTKALNDKVPNVRLNAFKLYTSVQNRLDNKAQQEFRNKAKALEMDPDIDVQYFAQNYLQMK